MEVSTTWAWSPTTSSRGRTAGKAMVRGEDAATERGVSLPSRLPASRVPRRCGSAEPACGRCSAPVAFFWLRRQRHRERAPHQPERVLLQAVSFCSFPRRRATFLRHVPRLLRQVRRQRPKRSGSPPALFSPVIVSAVASLHCGLGQLGRTPGSKSLGS